MISIDARSGHHCFHGRAARPTLKDAARKGVLCLKRLALAMPLTGKSGSFPKAWRRQSS